MRKSNSTFFNTLNVAIYIHSGVRLANIKEWKTLPNVPAQRQKGVSTQIFRPAATQVAKSSLSPTASRLFRRLLLLRAR